MRHFRDQRAIRDAMVEMFEAEGARVVDRDGALFALFFAVDSPTAVAVIDLDRLAADIERKLS